MAPFCIDITTIYYGNVNDMLENGPSKHHHENVNKKSSIVMIHFCIVFSILFVFTRVLLSAYADQKLSRGGGAASRDHFCWPVEPERGEALNMAKLTFLVKFSNHLGGAILPLNLSIRNKYPLGFWWDIYMEEGVSRNKVTVLFFGVFFWCGIKYFMLVIRMRI